MRKIIVFTVGPYVGTTDACIAAIVPNSWTDDQIAERFLDWAWENWDQWCRDDEDREVEDEGPDVWFEDYDPKVHDRQRCGGGSFEEDFAQC